jgi:hypothetical protein
VVTTLATGSDPARVLIDAGFIYWFDSADADVWRIVR